MSTQRRPVPVAPAVFAVAREEHVTAGADGLAYYALGSLVPLGPLAFAPGSVPGQFGSVARALELVTGVGAARFEATFERVAAEAPGRARAVVPAAAISARSSLRPVPGVAGLFRDVYGTRRNDGLARRLLDGLLVLGTVVGGPTLPCAAVVALPVRVSGLAWSALAPLVLFVALAAALLPTYYVPSAARVTVREAAPGAVPAAGAWTLLGLSFGGT